MVSNICDTSFEVVCINHPSSCASVKYDETLHYPNPGIYLPEAWLKFVGQTKLGVLRAPEERKKKLVFLFSC